MLTRRRFKNTTLEELLVDGAQRPREGAQGISPGIVPGIARERLIRKARRTRATSRLREWLTSGLQPPK
jgi:hypothetical protein